MTGTSDISGWEAMQQTLEYFEMILVICMKVRLTWSQADRNHPREVQMYWERYPATDG